MIRNLRIRFIRIAMFAVILVLFLIIGAINILNYQNVVNSADSLLEILSTNDSRFPGMDPYRQDPPLREYEDDDGDRDLDDEDVWIREMENWNRSLSVRTGGRGRFSEDIE